MLFRGSLQFSGCEVEICDNGGAFKAGGDYGFCELDISNNVILSITDVLVKSP